MPGGSLSPAALGQGVSPTSIGQSFATGMVTGQPAAAGAHSLSEGAMTAMQSGSVPPPQATPPITTPPVVSAPTMAAGIEATHGPVDTPANTPGRSTGVDRYYRAGRADRGDRRAGGGTRCAGGWWLGCPRGTAAGLRL